MEEDGIVMYPSQGMGHLIPMVELAKLILTNNTNFCITILIHSLPPNTQQQQISANYIAAVSAAHPAISFRRLPALPMLPPSLSSPELDFELARLHSPAVAAELSRLSPTLRALVLDMFCDAAFVEAGRISVPTYYYITSAASSVACLLSMEALGRVEPRGFVHVPGLPRDFSLSDVPAVVLDRSAKVYELFLSLSVHLVACSGIVINTFELLEENALKALSGGEFSAPPIFAVGPVVSGGSDGGQRKKEVIEWLDLQPRKSVVFLCFGSMGRFSAEQLREVGLGLENSGHRFLWVVRDPPEGGAPPEEGTRGRGKVVKEWAPQAEILSHEAVGGFVTHCGWNSVLEAVCAGVPMAAWPLYAEQRLNAAVIVREMGVAVAVRGVGMGLVGSREVEECVMELMDTEKGRHIRERVETMRDEAISARESGGSSWFALTELTKKWKQTR